MLQPNPLHAGLKALLAAGLLTLATTLPAQVVVTNGPQIGSANPISAEPPVERPHTKPCTVQLFTNEEFADFNNKSFNYAPPSGCPGPWAKVVFSADFTVTAGRQFDRTAQFLIGNTNIFYGTTAEPRATISPSWHVESDLTDLSATFKTAQTGQALLGNFVGTSGGVDYTGIIYANAKIDFYPADYRNPAPKVADEVVPLPNMTGGATTLNTTASMLTQSVTLPRNTESLYLDVFAQSQSGDEFWWTCVPNDVSSELESCGNTAFRETEITVDGKPAGVAPVYPWIYTGGVDPYLWAPIPGVQTLNFKPFRVNLTPFAGLLADGQAHTVGVSVYNANSYFLATANLLVFTDRYTQQTSGGLIADTLSPAPVPHVTENLTKDASGNVSGTVDVNAKRNYSIQGWVKTSHGRVETTVDAKVNFDNSQNFSINASQYVQDITQATHFDATTTTRDGFLSTSETKRYSYPFAFKIDEEIAADGSATEANTSDQRYRVTEEKSLFGLPFYRSSLSNRVSSQDTDIFSAAGAFTGHDNQSSFQVYKAKDSLGHCYGEKLVSAADLLTKVKDDVGCEDNDGW